VVELKRDVLVHYHDPHDLGYRSEDRLQATGTFALRRLPDITLFLKLVDQHVRVATRQSTCGERPELLDCRAHDLDCASTAAEAMWRGDLPRLQPTWRPLIAMVFAYEGATEYDAAAARLYQDEHWGRSDGDTAVLELSAIARRPYSTPRSCASHTWRNGSPSCVHA
jgi:hypothetical protein